MEAQEKKSMTEHKISILEIILCSPYAVNLSQEEITELWKTGADFVFGYKPNKDDSGNR